MSDARSAPPATALVTRRVRRGRTMEFERLMAGMQAAAAQFPGHMGGFLIPPEQAEQSCYRMLFAFDTEAHLQDWMQSQERQRWHRRIADVTLGGAATRVLTGLETWFALPAARTKSPPPRWKMALVTWLGIFPLVLLLSRTIGALLAPFLWPALVVLVVTALVVTAMTWIVMPTLVRVFAGWLYPPSLESELNPTPTAEKL
ncbi:MAG: antibiotic biosynthesis monooxygenase [Rhodoferax sp.]|nr:antibiotic biosynthesis monooxygenase [Rhodoferax sp.]